MKTPLLLAMVFALTAQAETPQVDYLLQCQGCHRADGGGTPGSVPAFAGAVGRFLEVPGGREYLVRVPGSAQSPLDDAELAALLNWIVTRFGPTDPDRGFTPFTAAEVTRVRRPPLTDVGRVRRELLALMDPPPN
jgi:mono/diheme cytochrome c family protein